MTLAEQRTLLLAWQEYEAMVGRILPTFAARGLRDLGDDLDHMLICRSEVEEVLDKYPDAPELLGYRANLAGLDAELLLRRTEVVERLTEEHLARHRQRNGIPHSHWWCYLDELDREPRPGSGSGMNTRRSEPGGLTVQS
ncbi:MAG: hypothetical protein COZ06_28430 [Armatimonadetes bacterium CG_4_10_14_3_um_filter_66_18]|nr:hypothetical protein [Armatimonadota bacterium]OIO95571.1 MAG: hypothetical protein AUJ96_26495 [Armatimonadetes bacterium CG2_30_66_41]PIU95123.1 MAG: hypothetical protein COS65_04075 [Armatimonadetes bacterium CG06_land_8_20_14_3_00_66_21]PIX41428.1 MAG: hypothetical protein COZ57_23365 [Armatimonadetes bacterium CG_4_8_14_3_um_filter_66_20]PIY40203.1 MAG: hypothetical protein COZ06_28430 [Armatimonadetes bacterium CG_4_10_14_3_um_filter_66_18]PIZ30259.1 MAG: hypothetical protein COY42_34